MTSEKDTQEKLYRFHWGDKKVDESKGYSVADAFRRLGYGGGALRALDYWEEVSEEVNP